MARSFYLGTDAELYTGSNSFSEKITLTPTAFGLVAADALAYDVANSDYGTKYLASIDPLTRTKGKVAAKNASKKLLKKAASDLAKKIDGTATVTAEQLIELGLNVRATPTPIPAPGVRPGNDIVSVIARTVTVHIHDSASSTKRGKPAGCTAASIYSFVGAEYPEDPAGWQYEGSTTKKTFEVVFPDTVPAGSQVWICTTWLNRKQQTGPISIPVTTRVYGGLSSAAV